MHINVTLFLLIILLFLNFSNAVEYDLETILKLTIKNNKEIKLSKSDLKYANAQMKEAISTALPKINVNMQYNRNFLENIFYFNVGGEIQSADRQPGRRTSCLTRSLD